MSGWARVILVILAVCCLAVFGVATGGYAQDARPAVLDVRLGVHPDKTRFVIETSSPIDFRVFTLSDPYRVVIDLPELAWDLPDRPAQAAGLVLGYRHGLFEPGTMRVVLDLAGPVRIREAFTIPPRDGRQSRFVLDIAPTTLEAFASTGDLILGTRAPTPVAAVVVPMVPPTPPVDSRPLIAIDPGHGGVDPGAIGVGGIYEKTITLQVARELRRQLEASGRYRVMLTRDEDVFVRLRDRVAKARAAGADLFISLHADSIDKEGIRGLSVYTLSDKASDREAGSLAARENRSDAIAGIDLVTENDEVATILIDLAQRDTMNQSRRLANVLVEELRTEVKLLGNTHRSAGFAVLTAPDVPSILVEMGFLSSPQDARLLSQADHQKRLARGLVKAIDSYFAVSGGARRS